MPLTSTWVQSNWPVGSAQSFISWQMCQLSNGTVLAGRAVSSPADFGLYASNDNGATWTLRAASVAPGLFASAIVQLASGDLLASVLNLFGNSQSKIYKSTDLGFTWTLLSSLGSVATHFTDVFNLIETSPGHVLAAQRDSTAFAVIVYRSTDSGATWTTTYNQSDDGGNNALLLFKMGSGVLGLCANKSVGAANTQYQRSIDDGQTWTNTVIDTFQTNYTLVGMTNGGTVFALAFGQFISSTSTHLYKSVDNGLTFTSLGTISSGNGNIAATSWWSATPFVTLAVGRGFTSPDPLEPDMWATVDDGASWSVFLTPAQVAQFAAANGRFFSSSLALASGRILVVLTDYVVGHAIIWYGTTTPPGPPVPPPVPPVSVPAPPGTSSVGLFTPQGSQIAIFTDWKSAIIKHRINDIDTMELSFDAADPRTQLFGVDFIIELQRQVGSYRYVEFSGLHRTSKLELTADQHYIYTSTSVGYLDLVHRRTVMYPSMLPQTLKSAPGETVIKQIVSENVGPGAASPLRYRNGVTQGFFVDADSGQGLKWTDVIGNENVLDVIKKIAALTSVDYTVVRTGPGTFLFKTGFPQLGNDLSAIAQFSPQLGNMVNPIHTMDWADEVNAVVVLGPGQDGSRLTLTVAGPDLSLSPWNAVEGTASPHTLPGPAGVFVYEAMQFAGNQKLTDAQPSNTFTFDPLQGDMIAYGRDYRVGDLIAASLGGVAVKLKVVGASVTIAQGKEVIKIEFGNLRSTL